MPSSTSSREGSTTKGFSNTSISEPTRWKRLRLQVMKMATVERLQLLWALLALFGTMSWLSLMPAYAFRNKLEVPFGPHSYAFFLVATVATSLSAIWQSLCPFLVRQSQRALLPRVINHPATQTATILISVILTILNFFSWIVLASDKEFGAKKSCLIGPLAKEAGYTAQCRGVNVAIVFDVVVFLLWIPISLVIVCGTIERGLWWWGDDDGWAQNEAIVGGSNMMSEEEFDMKIGLGGVKQVKRRQTVHPDNLQHQDMVMIQQPKPAFVTPIASQFQSSSSLALEEGDDDDFTNFTPSSYRRHHHQRQQQQQQQRRTESGRLSRRPSNLSLSSRLSGFFGAGWGAGSMPPPEEPMPEMPAQYRGENSANVSRNNLSVNSQNVNGERKVKSSRKKEESKREVEEQQPEAPAPLHGAEYTSQWHSRRYDDWSVSQYDPQYQRYFYIEKASGRSQWDPPHSQYVPPLRPPSPNSYASQSKYAAPSHGYNSPGQGYNPPGQGYNSPGHGYNPPSGNSGGYGSPAAGYGSPGGAANYGSPNANSRPDDRGMEKSSYYGGGGAPPAYGSYNNVPPSTAEQKRHMSTNKKLGLGAAALLAGGVVMHEHHKHEHHKHGRRDDFW
ncbi:hypothetical protein BGZ46_009075 [Entomortierella lignicola]|nr:hypothetical protein BGZ46_009075 [Entomortierella lignicola]